MKILKWLGLVLVPLIAGLFIFLMVAFPKVGPAPDLTIERTKERVSRGEYLVLHVNDCGSCHSARVFEAYGYPPDRSKYMQGGFEMSKVLEGLPGEITSPNLTRLEHYTDGELYRAIAEGLNREGRPIFPMMPYLRYGQMDQEDIYSIIAYLRTLKPAGEIQPKNKFSFPFNLIARTIPAKARHQKAPSRKDSVAYGGYLVNAAACMDCHTPQNDKHEPLPGMEGAGGQKFPISYQGNRLVIAPPNITPDNETGIGLWSKKAFISSMRERGARVVKLEKVPLGEANHIMPYDVFSGMTDEDLGSIYDYLRTLAPVKNPVQRFTKL